MRIKDKIDRIFETYKYILSFHPVKYLGIFIMILGPLFFIYRFIFLKTMLYEVTFGSFGFLLIGAFIWNLGWDPYH